MPHRSDRSGYFFVDATGMKDFFELLVLAGTSSKAISRDAGASPDRLPLRRAECGPPDQTFSHSVHVSTSQQFTAAIHEDLTSSASINPHNRDTPHQRFRRHPPIGFILRKHQARVGHAVLPLNVVRPT